jgi:glycosyltransferase involved in cell wall biosynthesis
VGDGREKTKLMNLAKELHINDSIIWAGLQPKEALQSYYTQMDIVAIPSRFEGFGLTAIEAMSYGIAVVASRVDGLMEVVEDSVSGILVQSEDPSEFANAIITLLQDPSKRQQIGVNGYNRVKATFAYNIYQKTITNIYKTLLEGSRN